MVTNAARREVEMPATLITGATGFVGHGPDKGAHTFFISDGEGLSTTALLRRTAAALGRPARLIPGTRAGVADGCALAGQSPHPRPLPQERGHGSAAAMWFPAGGYQQNPGSAEGKTRTGD